MSIHTFRLIYPIYIKCYTNLLHRLSNSHEKCLDMEYQVRYAQIESVLAVVDYMHVLSNRSGVNPPV